jgi:4-amino-4-deoxy-L-arabinose transferase-like glycosyltransferase
MNKTIRIVIALIVLCGLIVPRIVDLTEFTAADEPFWLVVGANYYYALTHFEFENTVYEYHPAVTTMWIVTAAMLVYFPEYRGLMNGYFQQEKTSFDSYLVEQGRNPLDLLWWGRFFQVLVNVALWVTVFVFLRILLDEFSALVAVLFASFAPYLFGQSRMLNHESMVGLFSLITLLALTVYIFKSKHPFYLVLSAMAASLANLTKSSSIVLLPVIVIIIGYGVLQNGFDKQYFWLKTRSAAGIFLAWLGITVAFYFIFWPGMWVAPGKMLHEVYGNAFSYAFLGSRLSVSTGLEPVRFSIVGALQSMQAILYSIAWRMSPLTWIGVLLAIFVIIGKNLQQSQTVIKPVLIFFFLLAFAAISMFAVISGRDQPHYVLVSYVCFEVIAGLGWVFVLRYLAKRMDPNRPGMIQISLLGVVLAFQAAGLLVFRPYYYTYLNPVLTFINKDQVPVFFYGERMETAAAYLAKKPNAQYMTALVYFGRSFSYYFPGDTLVFKPVFFTDREQLQDNMRKSDYLVIYSGLHERLPILKEMTPEHVIDLNGRPYVEIYPISAVPPSFYEN